MICIDTKKNVHRNWLKWFAIALNALTIDHRCAGKKGQLKP